MEQSVLDKLSAILGDTATASRPLSGGCIADVSRVDLASGSSVVIKHDPTPDASLDVEGRMLSDLAATRTVRTPEVLHAEPGLLVIEHIPNDGARTPDGGRRFAEALAALHAVTADSYGYAYDTPIGPLTQSNTPITDWPVFYAENRILPIAETAHTRGGIGRRDLDRLGRLCAHTADLIGEPPARPALIHGDLWAGNVLWNAGEVVAVIDPAVYHGDPEIELAFIDLMGCFERSFFDRYDEVAGIRPGFRERRRDLYTLYPLLVHAALFGGGYGASAMGVAGRLGF